MMSGRNYLSIAAVGRRFLSSTSGTEAGANGERGSMIEFMKNIAEKRKTEGAVEAPSLWAKLNKEVEDKQAETQRERPSFPRRDNNDARNGGRGNSGRGNNNLGGRGYSNNNGGGRGGNFPSSGGRGGGGSSAGRGYNTRNTGGGRTSNFAQNGGDRGGRGGRGGGRGGGGRGGGRGGALRTLGGGDDDEYEGQGRSAGGGRRPRGDGDEGFDDDEEPPRDASSEFENLFGAENGNPYYEHGSLPDSGGQPLDPLDELILFDTDYFENALDEMDNVRINTKGQDVLEQVLAHAFIESIKTPDNRYIEELDMPNRKRVQLPEPRSMVQLYNYTQPPALQNSQPDDEGVELANQAWGVIHQNYYYSDADKYRMVEKVATLQRKLLKHMAAVESDPEGVDLIFQPQFRKGCEYEEEEERLAALNKIAPATEAVFQQAETDWSVEAVVDEDQL